MYVNKIKLAQAELEASKTGEDVKEIYLKLGGKFVEDEATKAPKAAPAKAAKKVSKKK